MLANPGVLAAINPMHAAQFKTLTGSDDPAAWYEWARDPWHAALIARADRSVMSLLAAIDALIPLLSSMIGIRQHYTQSV